MAFFTAEIAEKGRRVRREIIYPSVRIPSILYVKKNILKNALQILTLFTSLNIYGQEPEISSLNECIGENYCLINEDDNKSFSILDSNIQKYKVFLVGETHYSEGNDVIQFELFKYLYYHAGVRVIIFEAPYSIGRNLNTYIQSGDTLPLKFLAYRPELIKKLYEFNSKLPNNDKIIAKAIDIEQDYFLSVFGLADLIPKDSPPEIIKSNIEKLQELNKICLWRNITKNEFIPLLDILKKDVIINSKAYIEYLKQDFESFTTIIKGASINIEHPYDRAGIIVNFKNAPFREKFLYDNFMKIVAEYPSLNYFGQFGEFHTDKNSHFKKDTSLFMQLNDSTNSFLNNKVLSIHITYPNQGFLNYFPLTKKQAKKLSKCLGKRMVMLKTSESSPLVKDFFELSDYVIISCGKRK